MALNATIAKDTIVSSVANRQMPGALSIVKDTIVSSVPERQKPGALSIVKRLVAEQERLGVSAGKLCRIARISLGHYWRLRRGACVARASTLKRLRVALAQIAAGRIGDETGEAVISHRAIVRNLALELKLDAGAMLRQDFACERPSNETWRQASVLRRYAIWIAVTELQRNGAAVARAVGVERQAVHQAVRFTEHARDEDAALTRLLDRVAADLTGREAA
jgi:hypothetical protein